MDDGRWPCQEPARHDGAQEGYHVVELREADEDERRGAAVPRFGPLRRLANLTHSAEGAVAARRHVVRAVEQVGGVLPRVGGEDAAVVHAQVVTCSSRRGSSRE